MSVFRFKQFSINQDKTAMKVGTDGVLLACWLDSKNAKNILDIGAGTGLISLILAQRNSLAQITAIEIEEAAAIQCQQNFDQSKWSDRLQLKHCDILDLIHPIKFDLIVSNPPFFQNSTQGSNKQRNLARHQNSLSFKDLLSQVYKLSTPEASFHIIIPYLDKDSFMKLAEENHFFIEKYTLVRGNAASLAKRVLFTLRKQKTTLERNELIIEISRHLYTPEYIRLTKDFYLNF